MSGFTKDEVLAELARRTQAQRDIESSREEAHRRKKIANADAECVHCHIAYNSWTEGGGGFCDNCFHAD